MLRLVASVLLAGLGLSGCVGVSQKRLATDQAGPRSCPAGVRLASDGLIDDFEDENGQLAVIGGRNGYWWTKADKVGSTIGPSPFRPSEGGAEGSEFSLHATGKTANGSEAWGAGFGVDMLTQTGATYDASRYAGISFRARVSRESTRKVRFQIGDINTHPSGKVCRTCWNHFGKDLILTPQWKEYRILFAEARQADGWGDPRPAAVDPSRIVAIDWSFTAGQAFDIDVDDIGFLECR